MDDRNRFARQLRWLAASLLGLVSASCAIHIGGDRFDPDAWLTPAGTMCQNGELKVIDAPAPGMMVYYPVPYVSPPNLTIKGINADDVEVVQQCADYFVIRPRKSSHSGERVKWHAVGIPVTGATLVGIPSPAPVPEPPTPGLEAPALPAQNQQGLELLPPPGMNTPTLPARDLHAPKPLPAPTRQPQQ